MGNQIINLLVLTATGTAQGIALEFMLETKESTKRWFRLLYWTILALGPSAISVFIASDGTTVIIRNIIHMVLMIIAIFWFYKDAFWKRFIGALMVYLGMACGELMFFVAIEVLRLDKDLILSIMTDKTSNISIFCISLCAIISTSITVIIAQVWRRVFHKKSNMKYFYAFMVYVLNHFLTIGVWANQIFNYQFKTSAVLSLLTSTICEVVLFVIMFSQSEKEALQEELVGIKQKTELEHVANREIEVRRKGLLQFTDTNKEKVKEISQLLQNNETKEAEIQLEELLNRIESTREYPYCGIPIVNAILSEKKKECEKHGIKMDVNIRIPEQLTVEQMDICSVFGNMLDNAIRACKKMKEENSFVYITAGAAGGYLIIKCENSCITAPSNKPEGTGYGLKILKDIANRYEGEFQTEYKEQKYYAQLSMKA